MASDTARRIAAEQAARYEATLAYNAAQSTTPGDTEAIRASLEAQIAERQAQLDMIAAKRREYAQNPALAASGGLYQYDVPEQLYRDEIEKVLKPKLARLSQYPDPVQREQVEAVQMKEAKERLGNPRGRMSSASKATGYNPATGRVETGRGDGKSTVVSQSKYDEQRAGIESGYTKGATVDKRVSDIFTPVDNGIFSPTPRATPSRESQVRYGQVEPQRQRAQTLQDQPPSSYTNPSYIVDPENRIGMLNETLKATGTPQRTRTQTMQGQPDSIYANPLFVSREEQARRDAVQPGISLAGFAPSAKPTKNYNYQINLYEVPQQTTYTLTFPSGTKLEGLTEAEVKEYQKVAALGNALYKLKKEKVKAENKAQVEQLKTFVANAKAQGYKTISVQTTEGPKDIPINRAMYDLRKGKVGTAEITGIGLVPNIPEGYTLTGSLSAPVLLPESKTISQDKKGNITTTSQVKPTTQPEKPKEDLLGQTLQNLSDLKSNNPLVQFGKGLYKEAVGSAASLVNFERYAGSKLTESLTGKPELVTYTTIPTLTASSELAGGLTTAALKTYQKGNIKYFPSAAAEAVNQTLAVARNQSIPETIGGAVAFLAPFPKIDKITKIAAIKAGTLPLYYGDQGVIKAVTELRLGYGAKTLPIAGRYAKEFGGGFYKGGYDPARIQLEKMSAPAVRFNRNEPVYYTQTQQELFRKAMLYAEQKGITKPGLVSTQKQIESELKRQANVKFEMKKTLPSKIIEQLPEGKPTYNVASTLGKLVREKTITPIKGSIIAVLGKDRLARPAKDIDAEINALKPKQSSEKLEQARAALLQTDVGKTAKLEAMGSSNIAIKDLKTGKAEELVNLITSKEQIKNVIGDALPEKGKVFGKEYDKGKIKINIPDEKEKLITKTPFYQLQTKAAEITGIETAESLGKAKNLTPDKIQTMLGGGKFVMSTEGHRGKSIMDFYMQTRDAAKIQFFKGDRKGALESAKTMVAIQKYYGTQIDDFGAAIREYKPTLEIGAPETIPSLTEKIGGSAFTASKSTPAVITPAGSSVIPRDRKEVSLYSSASSPITRQSATMSAKVSGLSSPYSPLNRTSVRSSAVISSKTSSSPLDSIPSAKSLFGSSSGKASPKSSASPASPVPSAKSLFGSSPKSGGVPTSPKSPGITSPTSPLVIPSPKSPLITSPLSPVSPRPIIPPKFDLLKPKSIKVPVMGFVPFLKDKTSKYKKTERKGIEFIGSTNVSSVLGFRNKKTDLTYGAKSGGIALKNIRFTEKRPRRPSTKDPFGKQKRIKL